MTDREANRTLALVAGLIALAGPRRTRPLAGFLYGVWLSRAQSSQLATAQTAGMATMLRLFDEKTSVGRRVDQLEAIIRSQYGRGSIEEIHAGAVVRLPEFMAARRTEDPGAESPPPPAGEA